MMKNLLSLFPLEIRKCPAVPSAHNWNKALGEVVLVVLADVRPSDSIIREAHDWPHIYSPAAQTTANVSEDRLQLERRTGSPENYSVGEGAQTLDGGSVKGCNDRSVVKMFVDVLITAATWGR